MGVALGHKWSKATCTEPKTCTVCKKTEGTASTHSWKAATYTAPKTCTVCNATEGKVLDNSAEKEKEIKSENWRHEEAVDSIKLNYQATINANEDQISIIRSVIGYTNYTQSQFDSLQQTYSKKAYQLELLKMGNGSAVQIQQLEYEVSSLRTQLAQMHIALQYQQEITNLENSNINLRQRMQTELAAENALHRQKLQAIEDKYS